MHDIEPFYGWREKYIAAEDDQSSFFGNLSDEFTFTNKVYNYFIHPQWDAFGTDTLYLKILFVDYDDHFAIIEFIGEWNDCINNDIMFLKRNVIDHLVQNDIYKFVLCMDNVLNFHSSDESYYEEWYDDIKDDNGYICCLNVLDHVNQEMVKQNIHYYANFGTHLDDLQWRNLKPKNLIIQIESILSTQIKSLH